jgi:hypothetical protein
MVADATALIDAVDADLWVVQRDTRGPFAERSTVPARSRIGCASSMAWPPRGTSRTRRSSAVTSTHPVRIGSSGCPGRADRGQDLPLDRRRASASPTARSSSIGPSGSSSARRSPSATTSTPSWGSRTGSSRRAATRWRSSPSATRTPSSGGWRPRRGGSRAVSGGRRAPGAVIVKLLPGEASGRRQSPARGMARRDRLDRGVSNAPCCCAAWWTRLASRSGCSACCCRSSRPSS